MAYIDWIYYSLENQISSEKYTVRKWLYFKKTVAVVSAACGTTNKEVVIKILNIDTPEVEESAMREISIMAKLKHPNIAKLYRSFKRPGAIFLVMENCGSESLHDFVMYTKPTEEGARVIFRQLLSAVDYCHSLGYYHGDIKLDNVILNQNNNVKLIDFGFSNTVTKEPRNTFFSGTQNFAAPEILFGIPFRGPETDIWSLGIVLFLLCSGKFPFAGSTSREVSQNVVMAKFEMPKTFSKPLRNLLKKLITTRMSKRQSLDILKNDPWINKNINTSSSSFIKKIRTTIYKILSKAKVYCK